MVYMGRERQVRQLLRQRSAELRRVLAAPIENFEKLGVVTRSKYNSRTIYIDRGSKVLGVAHLDSVQTFGGYWQNKQFIAASTIDNRLGAWLMLYGLPALGIHIDVLLTEDEEMGMSTAGDYETDKEYNWAFSFDRTGDDVACYQYLDDNIINLMKPYGLHATHGTYSDVADLNLGIKGFNFGCGMHSYHSANAYCRISELVTNISRFINWYRDHSETRFVHTISKAERWGWSGDKYHVNMTDKEWDDYINSFEKGADGVWRKTTKTEQAGLLTTPRKYWTTEQQWLHNASLSPAIFFDGETNGDDWLDFHLLDDGNRGKQGICQCHGCDGLFVWADTVWSNNYQENLCKACFYLFNEETIQSLTTQ